MLPPLTKVRYFSYLIPYLLLMFALYFLLGKKRSGREYMAFALAVLAAMPAMDGLDILYKEQERQARGVVLAGVVVEKLSSTGAGGTRTIGDGYGLIPPGRYRVRRRPLPTVLTSDGFSFSDKLARQVLTGSIDAWVISYRYPCDGRTCWMQEVVSRELWSKLQPGSPVSVRRARDTSDEGRLNENPMSPTGYVKVLLGILVGGIAAIVSGWRPRLPRRRFVTVPAVILSVEPVNAGGKQHWRVGYAYFSPDGTACECSDEVYVGDLRPGDKRTAVYPADHPHLGTLQT